MRLKQFKEKKGWGEERRRKERKREKVAKGVGKRGREGFINFECSASVGFWNFFLNESEFIKLGAK